MYYYKNHSEIPLLESTRASSGESNVADEVVNRDKKRNKKGGKSDTTEY